ncbi:putative nucleic acid binding protein [Potexvirus nesignambrosiae]|uniref:Putative nucleic acid binding protein n=1 Tax=Potexvirus nesignambrosiae TaxID=1417304 RepID=V5V1R4_9VIRU|nr:putative nucleic acid binding protein [Ambrosia asymptomatic virus 1]AHB87038.1 putative nucleic acid binding protein [Ambrosia asymptomatic virus 1]
MQLLTSSRASAMKPLSTRPMVSSDSPPMQKWQPRTPTDMSTCTAQARGPQIILHLPLRFIRVDSRGPVSNIWKLHNLALHRAPRVANAKSTTLNTRTYLMAHLNFLACLYFTKPSLPPELIQAIYKLGSGHCTEWNKSTQQPWGCGTSKSAIKRRIKRYNKCPNCGRERHPGRCKWSSSHAQQDIQDLLRIGAIRLQAERPIRPNSNLEQIVEHEMAISRQFSPK